MTTEGGGKNGIGVNDNRLGGEGTVKTEAGAKRIGDYLMLLQFSVFRQGFFGGLLIGCFVDFNLTGKVFRGGKGAGQKVFESGRAGTFGLGHLAGKTANAGTDDGIRPQGPFLFLVFEGFGNDLVPDRGGAGNAGGNITHGGIVVVADPNGNQTGGSPADGPVVAQVVGGAGFDGNFGVVFHYQPGAGAESLGAGVVVQQNMIDYIGSFDT